MGVRWNGCSGHRWARTGAIGRRILAWLGWGHISLWWRHLCHIGRSKHRLAIRRRHTGWIMHGLHVWTRHIGRTWRRHTSHYRLCRVTIGIWRIDVTTGCRLVFFIRWRWHGRRAGRGHVGRLLGWIVWWRRKQLYVALAAIWPHSRNLFGLSNCVVLEWIEIIFDIDKDAPFNRAGAKERVRW